MQDWLKKFKLTKEAEAKLKNKKKLKKELAEGKSPQQILGFSDEVMAEFYGAARQLFEAKKHKDAANAFLFLITLNASNHDYWLGLGMSTQMCGEYDMAIDAYEMAASCCIDSPVPYFFLAKCLFAMHDRENAIQAIDLAIEYAGDHDEYRELKLQAIAAKDLLNSSS